MKCKLSKLFFLALIGAISVKGYSQTEEERKNIASGYDSSKLEKLGERFKAERGASYAKALEIARQKGLPIDGVTKEGAYFSLKGVDSETGELIYYQTYNNTTTNSSVQTARAQHLYNGGSLGINVQGQNMILGIWDGGQPQASHPNLGIERTINKDGQLTTSSGQDGIDHATHVGGTMIGNGSSQIAARGLAFNGILWANTWQDDLIEMRTEALQGLLVSNHSYGIGNTSYINQPGIYGRYNADARDLDELLFEVDKYQPVYAAGNDRTQITGAPPNTPLNPSKVGYDQMVNETVSKNAVVVGAINGFTSYPGASGVVMSTFSQWGPTDDFRVKPDVVAKGVDVYSSAMPFANSVNIYDSYQGTSMAAPAVTAVFALWQQYSRQLWPFGLNAVSVSDRYLRSATIRALMAHTASEAGSIGPDAKFGWGVIDAEAGVKVMKEASDGLAIMKENVLTNQEVYDLVFELDGTQPLTVTLAWTDKEGTVVGGTDSTQSVLVNDLDVRVIHPGGSEVLPWRLVPGNNPNIPMFDPVAQRGDNTVDNIEKIQYQVNSINAAPAGEYTVRVSHKGNALNSGSQKYSLIVSGGIVNNVSVDNNNFDNLKIYPNPATDVLNISADYISVEGAGVVIYDMLGKKVYQNDSLFSFSGDSSIDVSSFSQGVYLVEILKDGKKDTRKFIKK